MRYPAFSVIMSLLFLVEKGSAVDRTVGPGGGFDFATVTNALAASSFGDRILVASGTYNVTSGETFPLNMKTGVLLLRATELSLPKLRGDGNSAIIHFDGVSFVTLDGFLVSGGGGAFFPYSGGGINLINSFTVAIQNCEFTENLGEAGGGVYLSGTSATISQCTFHRNRADQGGGFYCGLNSTLTLTNSIVAENQCDQHGGGIRLINSSANVLSCTIIDFCKAKG